MAISTLKVMANMGACFSIRIDCSHNFTIDQPKLTGGNGEGQIPWKYFLRDLPV